jgi:hypothetical protein
MSILCQARLADSRKKGRWTYFRLAGEDSPAEARRVASLVIAALGGDAQIRADVKRLKEILKIDPEDLCRRQNECK